MTVTMLTGFRVVGVRERVGRINVKTGENIT